jgi:hypothetical protein
LIIKDNELKISTPAIFSVIFVPVPMTFKLKPKYGRKPSLSEKEWRLNGR